MFPYSIVAIKITMFTKFLVHLATWNGDMHKSIPKFFCTCVYICVFVVCYTTFDNGQISETHVGL